MLNNFMGTSFLIANSLWQREGAFCAPATSKAIAEQFLADQRELTPFSLGFSLSTKCDVSVVCAVIRLFGRICPSNIVLFIMAVRVDTVNGVVGRRYRAKRFVKFFKVAETKLNTSAAIVGIRNMTSAITSAFGHCVFTIFLRPASDTMSMSVVNRMIDGETSTRASRARFQAGTWGHRDLPTITPANPIQILRRTVTENTDNSQSAKLLTNKVFETKIGGMEWREREPNFI